MTWCQGKNTGLGIGRAGFSSGGCHLLVAGVGEPQPLSGFYLTFELIGWETGLCPSSQLHDSHGPQAPDGRSCTDPWVSGLIIQCSCLWLSCISFLQDPMPCLPVTAYFKGWGMDFYEAFTYGGGVLCRRGVSLWLSLSAMTKPLSLFQAFQASVSSRGCAW